MNQGERFNGWRETPEWCCATILSAGVGVIPRLLGGQHRPCHEHAAPPEFPSLAQMALPSSLVLGEL